MKMNNNKDIISIIVPVYNAEKTISRCLESLIKQTYNNIEIICVDDGSKDYSLNILQSYELKDTRIKVYTQQNSGPAKTRNFAISKMSGKYLMFCDADDWYENDMVQVMIESIKNNNVDIAMCDCKIIDLANGNIQSEASNTYHQIKLLEKCSITYSNIIKINVVLWNKIFKKELIDKYKIEYPTEYEHDDLVFVYKYLSIAKTYYGINKKLYNYVVGNPVSIMGKVQLKTNINHEFDFLFARNNLYNFLIQNKINKKIINAYIKQHASDIKWFYSLLNQENQICCFYEIKKFITKNPILLKYDFFKKIYKINNPNTFDKFMSELLKISYLEKIFSIRNDSIHKVIRFLGFKIKFIRPKFKSLIKPSLDYLETHIVEHCNLNCAGCSHYCPVTQKEFVSIDNFKKDMHELSSKLNIKQIRLMGGEPLLHKQINIFLNVVRIEFPKTDIRLVTNGILLPEMPESFWQTLKANNIIIDLSKYPPTSKNFSNYLDLIANHNIECGTIHIANKFWLMFNNLGKSNIEKTHKNCIWKKCVNLRKGYLSICPNSCYVDRFNSYFKTSFPVEKGIDIYSNTGKKIIDYLNKPVKMCKFCLEEKDFEYVSWGQSKKEINEWFAKKS